MRMRQRLSELVLSTILVGLLASCAFLDGGPEARFDVSPVVVYAGDTIEFDAGASSGPASIVSYSWDLGNGAMSAGQMVTTTFFFFQAEDGIRDHA